MTDMFKVTTPVPAFTGMSAGVNFTDGVATVDGETQAAALRYFRGAGYIVEEADENQAEPEADADPGDEMPKKSATTDAWRAYAVQQGMPEAEAAELSRDQLVERYTSKENQS